MTLLENLYRETLMAHNSKPNNKGELPPPAIVQSGVNQSCGDKLKLYLDIQDGSIVNVKWNGTGCAISMASASMMSKRIIGKSLEHASELVQSFEKMIIHGETPNPPIGELETLAGIHQLPARVKCATLCWNALKLGLEESRQS